MLTVIAQNNWLKAGTFSRSQETSTSRVPLGSGVCIGSPEPLAANNYRSRRHAVYEDFQHAATRHKASAATNFEGSVGLNFILNSYFYINPFSISLCPILNRIDNVFIDSVDFARVFLKIT